MNLKKTGYGCIGMIHLAAERIHWLNNVNTVITFKHRPTE
jgi:hypothetical protein